MTESSFDRLVAELIEAGRSEPPTRRRGGTLELPPPAAGPGRSTSVERLLRSRRSARAFDDSPVAGAHVARLLGVVATADSVISTVPAASPARLEAVALVAEPGHRQRDAFVHDDGGLRPAGRLEAHGPRTFSPQIEIDGAPLLVVVGGRFDALDSAYSYRRFLVRAGAAAQVAWLEAIELGLVAALVHAFFPQSLAPIRSALPPGFLGVVALAVGHAPASDR